MVAEPVTETGLPEVGEPEVPNPSETVVETTSEESTEEENFDDVLALLNEGSESGGGTEPATQGETEQKPRTEAEIEAGVIQKLQAQGQTQQRARQIEGMRNSFKSMDADLQTLQAALDNAYQMQMKNRIDQHNGHWNELYHNDVTQAHAAGGDGVRTEIHKAVQSHLGKETYDELLSKHQEWGTLLEDYAERYAKKQGWLPKSEAAKKFSDGQRDTLAKLKKLGIELPRGGNEDKRPAAQGGGGVRITSSNENDQAFIDGRITREQYAANEQRFKK